MEHMQRQENRDSAPTGTAARRSVRGGGAFDNPPKSLRGGRSTSMLNLTDNLQLMPSALSLSQMSLMSSPLRDRDSQESGAINRGGLFSRLGSGQH